MLKKIYHIFIPLKFRHWLHAKVRMPLVFFKCYMYDLRRHLNHCASLLRSDNEHRLSRITALYHVLEKGLSFSNSRFLFGKDRVMLLVKELKEYMETGGPVSAIQWQSAVLVLESYLVQNKKIQDDAEKNRFLENLAKEMELLCKHLSTSSAGGGTIECFRDDIVAKGKGEYPEMAHSRFSVRHFSKEPVNPEIIENAVVWAQKSPSVCNRQGSRVHAIKDRKKINEILDVHGGTRGFTEQIDTLMIVTGDLRIFFGVAERNQVYVDAGIFAMNILYGLHYQGVGACPLHWCVEPKKDLLLRDLINIPAEETITAFIAVGSLPERFKVAYSQRRSADEVLKWN